MNYLTIREFSDNSEEIRLRVEAGEDFVITRNGVPIALLVPTQPQEVEFALRALRLSRFGSVVWRMQEQSKAEGRARLGDDRLQAEIAVARADAVGGSTGAGFKPCG